MSTSINASGLVDVKALWVRRKEAAVEAGVSVRTIARAMADGRVRFQRDNLRCTWVWLPDCHNVAQRGPTQPPPDVL